MIGHALAIAGKDLRLVYAGGAGVAQPMLLGLLLIFLFSLAGKPGAQVSPEAAAGIFLLASLFAQVLIFNGLYALEEAGGARQALLLSPATPQAVWLGKALAGLFVLLPAQLVFLPATLVFLGQSFAAPMEAMWPAVAVLVLCDMGLIAVGSLLGALSQGQAARESLLSIIVFPLLIPLLLAGIRVMGAFFAAAKPGAIPQIVETTSWLGIAGAFDAVFTGAALLLFPFAYSGEE